MADEYKSPEVSAFNTFVQGDASAQALLKQWEQANQQGNRAEQDRLTPLVNQLLQAHGLPDSAALDNAGVDIKGAQLTSQGGSLLKDVLEGAAIGGLGLTGLGIAGIGPMAGLFGAGAEAAGAGAGAAETAATTAADVLPSTTIGTGFVPAITGGTGLSATDVGAGVGSSILSGAAKPGLGTTLQDIGKGVASAASAAGNTRRADTDTNVSAQSQYNSELMSRAEEEDRQRRSGLQDVARASYFQNAKPGGYDPFQLPGQSQQYMQTLGNLADQGSKRLVTAPQYGTNTMPALQPYSTKPGTFERIGNIAGPVTNVLGTIGKYIF